MANKLDVAKRSTLHFKAKVVFFSNGKFLFGRDEYHRGAEIDQYRLAGELKKGRNTILVKLCQNEQKEEWTKEWEFQLRITDALGTPIASAKP